MTPRRLHNRLGGNRNLGIRCRPRIQSKTIVITHGQDETFQMFGARTVRIFPAQARTAQPQRRHHTVFSRRHREFLPAIDEPPRTGSYTERLVRRGIIPHGAVVVDSNALPLDGQKRVRRTVNAAVSGLRRITAGFMPGHRTGRLLIDSIITARRNPRIAQHRSARRHRNSRTDHDPRRRKRHSQHPDQTHRLAQERADGASEFIITYSFCRGQFCAVIARPRPFFMFSSSFLDSNWRVLYPFPLPKSTRFPRFSWFVIRGSWFAVRITTDGFLTAPNKRSGGWTARRGRRSYCFLPLPRRRAVSPRLKQRRSYRFPHPSTWKRIEDKEVNSIRRGGTARQRGNDRDKVINSIRRGETARLRMEVERRRTRRFNNSAAFPLRLTAAPPCSTAGNSLNRLNPSH